MLQNLIAPIKLHAAYTLKMDNSGRNSRISSMVSVIW